MKIVHIDQCGDCPHRYYEGNEIWCGKENLEVDAWFIPKWCPLPNAEGDE